MNRKNLQLIFSSLIVVAVIVWAGFFTKYRADTHDNNLKIYFLNVGQGDSEYIKTPTGADILIDGGPDNSVLTELGKVMDFGDREINLVILTHPHADHITGLIQVLQRYKIDEIWESGVEYPSSIYDAWKSQIATQKIADDFVVVGDKKAFDDVSFKVLYPLSSLKNSKMDNVNNASVITELNYKDFTSLFLGDAEISAQDQILNSVKHSNILKVAHHGSTNGLDESLLKIVQPNISIVEVGAKNTYGHPAPSVINYLKSIATQIYRTDQDGTIEISSDGSNWQVNTGL